MPPIAVRVDPVISTSPSTQSFFALVLGMHQHAHDRQSHQPHADRRTSRPPSSPVPRQNPVSPSRIFVCERSRITISSTTCGTGWRRSRCWRHPGSSRSGSSHPGSWPSLHAVGDRSKRTVDARQNQCRRTAPGAPASQAGSVSWCPSDSKWPAPARRHPRQPHPDPAPPPRPHARQVGSVVARPARHRPRAPHAGAPEGWPW